MEGGVLGRGTRSDREEALRDTRRIRARGDRGGDRLPRYDIYEWLYTGFAGALGTPSILAVSNFCFVPRAAMGELLVGGHPVVDYDGDPRLVMVWGANPIESNPDEYKYPQLDAALRRGAELVVVDPRRTALAARADIWLRVRPAADLPLALGMAKVIVEEGLYDRDFVENHSYRFGEFRDRLSMISHAWVEEVSRVGRREYARAARDYATAKPAAIHWGVGIDQGANSAYTAYALLDLMALTGNLDAPGGNAIFDQPPVVPTDSMFPGLPEEARARTPGKEYRLAWERVRPPHHLTWDAILTGKPYPVRAMIVLAANLLVTRPNSLKILRALRSLDFLVVADMFMTPTARLAHVVLPAASWLEREEIADRGKHHGHAFARRRLFRVGGARSDAEILLDLGRRMGLPGFRWGSIREFLDEALRPSGLTWEEFSSLGHLRGPVRYLKYRTSGFPTPSGKYEFVSGKLEEWGYPGFPDFRDPVATDDRYPLILITGARRIMYMASEGRQVQSLRRLHPHPEVEIHPETAARLGISEGDWVAIETGNGRIYQRARLNPWLDPQVVSAEYGWWYPEMDDDRSWTVSNVNVLTGDGPPLDPLMGGALLRGLACRVERAEDPLHP